MAKISGGLMSLKATGTIGKAVTFSDWKGTAYARAYTKPANPQSSAQSSVRNVFTFLHNVYKQAPQLFRDPWEAAVKGQPLTSWNMFTKANLAALKDQTTIDALMFSNGAGGGTQPTSLVVTPGSGQLSCAITAPTPPTGWTIASAIAACLREQDPHVALIQSMIAGEDTTSPYTVVLTGLGAHAYRVGAWLKFTKPDGSIAYGASILAAGTST